MATTWDNCTGGLLRLPSGRTVRGRGLRDGSPAGPTPDFGLYLLGKEPPTVEWDSRWVRWRDFWLPADRADAADAFREVWSRSATQRVEVACGGGRGRTGTALACLAVMDGVPAGEAVAYVRAHYSPKAVEMPWQRRYVERFT
ncbi:phosphatase domain-containing protein [Gordonia rubripertincta]|uniref:Protein phosphatase n=1 Tax=Gordonia rubripertincta TaxID=36822 RepID=A0ABT4MX70_GORRU|nr:protein phosphatase [Gordonia rubripertincta]MCZ4551607.1 protein phosphatase [Gordonia rubripertincta]